MLRLWGLAQRPSVVAQCRIKHIHPTVTRSASSVTGSLVATAPSIEGSQPEKWTPDSIRTGLIARKRGMTAMWDDHGARYPVTVLQVCLMLQCSYASA
jgi:large subunit ribosomal protein L3